MITVPHAFLSNSDIRKILVDGLNCVIYKKAFQDNPDNSRYIATHAFTYVINGSLRISTHEESRVVRDGELIFLPKGLYLISDIIPEGEAFEAVVFFLDQKVVEDYANLGDNVASNRAISTLQLKASEKVKKYIINLIELYGDGNDHHITKSKLTEFLHLLLTSDAGASLKPILKTIQQNEKVGIKSLMEQHYDKPLKIEDYANLTGRSTASFHRDFKRLYNQGPKQWLIEKRLEKAKDLLVEDTEQSITLVAIKTGYESSSHFIKSFHKKFGISPKQFVIEKRKMMKVS